jgi:hypothetical protein
LGTPGSNTFQIIINAIMEKKSIFMSVITGGLIVNRLIIETVRRREESRWWRCQAVFQFFSASAARILHQNANDRCPVFYPPA